MTTPKEGLALSRTTESGGVSRQCWNLVAQAQCLLHCTPNQLHALGQAAYHP